LFDPGVSNAREELLDRRNKLALVERPTGVHRLFEYGVDRKSL